MTRRTASSAAREADLFSGQQRQLSLLLTNLLDAVHASSNVRDASAKPNNVFCIDGGRGAGKTFCLLTLEQLLKTISSENKCPPEWDAVLKRHYPRILETRRLTPDRATLIHPLRVIFPGDLERQELVLEAIFAGIRSDLEAALKTAPDDRLAAGRKLLGDLVHSISRAWSFARRLGVDAVVRNSLDYNDLVERYDDLNKLAAERLPTWRKFIDDYLKWRGISCLTIMLDDSDVRPELTYDILHTARTALNHPRIVTVIAGNKISMRHSLILLAMRELGPSIAALNQKGYPTGEEWRRTARIEVEQLLEKVLPDSHRFYIDRPDASGDFQHITGKTLLTFCDDALRAKRKEFVRIKMLRAINFEIDGNDRPSQRQAARLQDYLAWWLFRTQYAPMLGPSSARQIEIFNSYLPQEGAQDGPPEEDLPSARKRLPVVLFANPANYAFIQRLSDDDPNVIEWLVRQSLQSNWTGRRSFSVNGREVPEGTYSYNFIRYRLDLGLAQPLRRNSEALVPEKLLPWVRGRQRMRHFFLPRFMPKRPRKLGVAHWLDHAAIPGNCVYFHDLSIIPDICFAPRIEAPVGYEGGNWEANLWGLWPGLLELGRDETLQRYITEVVYPKLRYAENIRTAILIDVLEPSEHIGSSLPYLDFLRFELDTLKPDKAKTAKAALEAAAKILQKGGDAADAGRLIARYSAMATDLRRGWAAIRIYHNAVETMQDVDDLDCQGQTPRAMFAQIRNADRMRLYTFSEFKQALDADIWAKKLLGKFNRETLGNLVDVAQNEIGSGEESGESRGKSTRASSKLAIARKLLDSFGRDLSEERDYSVDQNASSEEWICGWRQIGRLMCDGWLTPNCEAAIIPREKGEPALNIFADGNPPDSNWRSARAFSWFLYGVAPSLPAMIHADLLSRVRRIEQFGGPNPQSILFQNREQIICDLLAALSDWENLLISLAGCTRYMKMKYLHIYCAVACEKILGRRNGETYAKEISRDMELESDLELGKLEDLDAKICEVIAKVGRTTPAPDSHDIWTRLHKNLVGERPLQIDVSMMPDASPSTLFGDGWLTDVVPRLLECELEGEDGVSHNGIFGETERWLWAAHYMLGVTSTVLKGRIAQFRASEAKSTKRSATNKRQRPEQ